MTPLLEIQDLLFTYSTERTLLKGLHWSIQPGEIHCLAGRNGCGKTTLLRLIIGLLLPGEGDILFKGETLSDKGIDFRAGKIGLALQNPDLQLFAPTVREELSFGPRNLQWDEEKIKDSLSRTLDLFDLSSLVEENPMLLTFGIRKKIALASIAAMNPELYLLDEPDWSLDRLDWERQKGWIQREARRGKSFLIISHNLEWMTGLCSHLLFLEQEGRWQYGRMEDLLLQATPPLEGTDLSRLSYRLKDSKALSPEEFAGDYLNQYRPGASHDR